MADNEATPRRSPGSKAGGSPGSKAGGANLGRIGAISPDKLGAIYQREMLSPASATADAALTPLRGSAR